MVTVTAARATPASASTDVSTGRYTAIARSSMTRIATTTGVSGLVPRPRSAMSLEMIPDDDTERTGAGVGPQPRHELVGRVLQPQGQQEQQDADLRAGADELIAGRELEHAAMAERQTAQQVQRDRGNPEAAGETAQDAEAQQHRPDLGNDRVGVSVHMQRLTAGRVV